MIKDWKLKRSAKRIEALTEQNENMNRIIAGLESENTILREKLNEYENVKEKIDTTMAKATDYIDSLRKAKKEYDTQIRELLLMKKKYQDKYTELMKTLKPFKSE